MCGYNTVINADGVCLTSSLLSSIAGSHMLELVDLLNNIVGSVYYVPLQVIFYVLCNHYQSKILDFLSYTVCECMCL